MRVTIDLQSREFVAATIFIAALIALLAWAVPAFAHSWYPPHCCSNVDCAPVEKVEIVPTNKVHAGMSLMPQGKLPSAMLITTKHGSVFVPEGFKRDTSRDGQMHACMRRDAACQLLSPGANCQMKLICFFEPPAI